jgi:hypothetical protein
VEFTASRPVVLRSLPDLKLEISASNILPVAVPTPSFTLIFHTCDPALFPDETRA